LVSFSLRALENESIEIFREPAAAAHKNPLMLYSIGEYSYVLLHLALSLLLQGQYPNPYARRNQLEFQGDDPL
jgi:3'-phosphoadenosine 5'-phosphosulfate sulfotransferase (PAPS reductase)/FAD synthetase